MPAKPAATEPTTSAPRETANLVSASYCDWDVGAVDARKAMGLATLATCDWNDGADDEEVFNSNDEGVERRVKRVDERTTGVRWCLYCWC